jgi:hypothetical protein
MDDKNDTNATVAQESQLPPATGYAEIEFYLMRFYKRPNDEFKITVFEVFNFVNGFNRSFAGIDYSPNGDGLTVSLLQA